MYKQSLGVCMCKFYRFFCWVTFCFGFLLFWLFRSHEMNAQLEEINCVCAGKEHVWWKAWTVEGEEEESKTHMHIQLNLQ